MSIQFKNEVNGNWITIDVGFDAQSGSIKVTKTETPPDGKSDRVPLPLLRLISDADIQAMFDGGYAIEVSARTVGAAHIVDYKFLIKM